MVKVLMKILSHGLLIAFIVAAFFLYINRADLFPQWFGNSPAASAAVDEPAVRQNGAQVSASSETTTGTEAVVVDESASGASEVTGDDDAPAAAVSGTQRSLAAVEPVAEPVAEEAVRYRPLEAEEQEAPVSTQTGSAAHPVETASPPVYRPLDEEEAAVAGEQVATIGTPVTDTTESAVPAQPDPVSPDTPSAVATKEQLSGSMAEASVTETPVTETPVTETPVTETPVTETPVEETHVTAAPVTETPGTQTPVTETPGTQTPTAEVAATEPVISDTTASQGAESAVEAAIEPPPSPGDLESKVAALDTESQPQGSDTAASKEQRLEAARTLYWQRNLGQAAEAYTRLGRDYPRDAALWGEIGNFYYSIRQLRHAGMAYYRTVSLLIDQGDQEQARQLLGVLYQLDANRARELDARLQQATN